ncbi:hypothetical protein VTN02DRAFT_5187 [Thermoascus thermophilus]
MDLTHNVIDEVIDEVDEQVCDYVHRGTELLDVTMELTDHAIDKVEDKLAEYVQGGKVHFSKKVDEVITAMDEGLFRHAWDEADTAQTHYFSKVHLYANSRLPPDLPPLRIHPEAYPLLRLAAKYSLRAYARPAAAGSERASHVDPDWRHGTKAMVIKSIPVDHMNTIVFAVRGTMSFRDWAVNMHTHPTPPAGFLDDSSNLCHEGFLDVARRMVHPVAERLRSLLRENPNRASCALLMTGHSAGGAVASLLYCHMLSETVQSELTHLRGCFRSVHCVTFGAPPVSLLPLQKPRPRPPSRTPHDSVFLAFINEGDPVARAEKAYVRSLLDLCISPAPGSTLDRVNRLLHPRGFVGLRELMDQRDRMLKQRPRLVSWKVPRATLSAAGQPVVLRERARRHSYPDVRESDSDSDSESDSESDSSSDSDSDSPAEEEIEAVTTTDEQLRGVIFGDPLMHSMILYAKRIEIVAREAGVGG